MAQVSLPVGLRLPRSVRNAPQEREGMYHRGVGGGGWQRRKHEGGGTEGSFVRQEAAETKTLSLGTDLEERSEGIKKRSRGPNRWTRWRTHYKER